MTDYSRSATRLHRPDTAHRFYHGAPQVEFMFLLIDGWQRRPKGGRWCAWLIASSVALLAFATSVGAQEARIRGSIERIEHGDYIVRSRSGDLLRLQLAPDAHVAASVRAGIGDIAAGAYIGTAALPQPDGSMVALELHIFHESMRGTAEGHREWDLLPRSTMTNATVSSVVRAIDAHVVTIRYKDGEKRIRVLPATTVVSYLPASVHELRLGAAIFVPSAKKLPNGVHLAHRIMVGRDVAPPQ